MNFETVESRYRPTPFWSWNEKLDTEETARQVCLMGEAGIGGFFMHARGGLQTPYMGEEWHENIRSAIAAAGKYGMIPWVYDEDGWPSGFGGGIVSGMGVEYQQKYLRIEAGDRVCETTVCHADGYHLYYEVNPFYVDTLDEKVVKLFIDRIYRPYAEQYGNAIAGFSPMNRRFPDMRCRGASFCRRLTVNATEMGWRSICRSSSIRSGITKTHGSASGS